MGSRSSSQRIQETNINDESFGAGDVGAQNSVVTVAKNITADPQIADRAFSSTDRTVDAAFSFGGDIINFFKDQTGRVTDAAFSLVEKSAAQAAESGQQAVEAAQGTEVSRGGVLRLVVIGGVVIGGAMLLLRLRSK